jgi:enoyl-CoA hydratase/carnithine racemase
VSFPTLIYEKQDAIAWITLNRPEVLNAYNTVMRDDLWEVLSAVRDDDDVRALILRGAGRAFCAGADLTEFGQAPSPTGGRRIRFARDVWALLHGLPIPTIAALHGHVLGSGLEMALFCDLRVAAEGTEFGMPEVQLGLIPAAGGTQTLPRVSGVGTALDLLLTGRRFGATEALRLGVVGRIVTANELTGEVTGLAQQLALLDGNAVRSIKRAVRDGADLPLEQGLRLEAGLAAQLRNTAGGVDA